MKTTGWIVMLGIAVLWNCTDNRNPQPEESSQKPVKAGAQSLIQLTWMFGDWVRETDRGSVFEKWKRENDSTWTGADFRVSGPDTVQLEQLWVESRGGNIYYVVDVPHNPAPVSFRLIKSSNRRAVFSNPEHDFPKQIIYSVTTPGFLEVRISGADTTTRRLFKFTAVEMPHP